MTERVGTEPHERKEKRQGHRNGHKPRKLTTPGWEGSPSSSPEGREGTFSTKLFARYQRSEKALVPALMEMYAQGVSTRRVAKIREELCGTAFSKSTVSLLPPRPDTGPEVRRECSLSETAYPYLIVDATYEKVPRVGRVVSQGVLIVNSIRDVFDTLDLTSALARAQGSGDKWRSISLRLASALEEVEEKCLSAMHFPAPHRRRLRTTNVLERLNQEIKRRTNVARIFPGKEACLLLVTALAVETSEEWVRGQGLPGNGASREHAVSERDRRRPEGGDYPARYRLISSPHPEVIFRTFRTQPSNSSLFKPVRPFASIIWIVSRLFEKGCVKVWLAIYPQQGHNSCLLFTPCHLKAKKSVLIRGQWQIRQNTLYITVIRTAVSQGVSQCWYTKSWESTY